MWNFKNNRIKTRFGEQPMSRIIASWIKADGQITDRHFMRTPFYSWMVEELAIDPTDAAEVIDMACSGKMEMEDSAKIFLRNWDGG